jgi:2-iminobutanoate/2-iminopropanoate deaminase
MEYGVMESKQAPAAVGPYSQARWAGDILFISGQLGLDPDSGEMAPDGVQSQALQAMRNLGAILLAAGLDFGQVAKTTIYLTDMEDFATVNQVYAGFFEEGAPLPARACVAVAGLPKGGLVEVEAVAYKKG